MVFIGLKLARKEIEERFLQVLVPAREGLRPALSLPSPSFSRRTTFITMAQRGLMHRALLGCWSKDVFRVAQASAGLHDTLFGPEANAYFSVGASTLPDGAPRGLHAVEGDLWLHALLPLNSIKTYALAWRKSRIKLNTPCTGQYMWGEPMRFDDLADVEAAGVMWLECSELADDETANFVVEFKWRPETMKSFFDVQGSATNSALVKITVEDPNGDDEMDDDLRFRMNLNPEENPEQTGMSLHRLSLQLVGGKTSYRVYQIFFHTIDPTYQVHVNVPDHRVPIFPTKEVFHQWHPLMDGLKRRPRIRFLLRLKSLEKGPLDAMCGCCG